MSEGYFPDGEPEEVFGRSDEELLERVRRIERKAQDLSDDDFVGHYKLNLQLLDLFPYSASIHIMQGELVEAIVAMKEQDAALRDHVADQARHHYERALQLEPGNSRAKLDLGLYFLNFEKRADKARSLLLDAQNDFLEFYMLASEGVDECSRANA